MKQGTLIQKLTILVLFLGVLSYLGGSLWRSLRQPYPTIPCYEYTVDDSVEATGLLVREEETIPGQSGIVDVIPDEGEKVGAGQSVAVVYRDESALQRRRELKALSLEAEQLSYSIQRGDTGWDNARLDESIIAAMTGLRASVATGDLTALEDQSLALKSLVLSREATYSGGAAGAAERIQAVNSEMNQLQSVANMDTTTIRVASSGVFSAETDGYESSLSPSVLDGLTPSGLDSLAATVPAVPTGVVGKLVTSSTWYFVANLTEAEAGRLTEGGRVIVRFSRDWSGDVSMRVERVSAPQSGRCTVTLSATSHLADTTLLRAQTVDVIFNSQTGIRIPKKALRTETWTEKDQETGEVVREYPVNGVYVLTGAQAEFRAVNILADDSDYYLVASREGVGRKTLRSGDEIIVASQPLFDGKVVR